MPESITTARPPSSAMRSRTYAISGPFVSRVPITAMVGPARLLIASSAVAPLPRVHIDDGLLELLERRGQVLRVQVVRPLPLLRGRAHRVPDHAARREVAVVGREHEVLVALELDVGRAVELDEALREPVRLVHLLVHGPVHPHQRSSSTCERTVIVPVPAPGSYMCCGE